MNEQPDPTGDRAGPSHEPFVASPPPAPPRPGIAPPAVPMASPPGVVNRVGKTRHPWGVWLLTLVTFGIYGLWWYYTVNRELRDFDQQITVRPGLSVCALIFGHFTLEIAPIVSIVRTARRIAQAQRFAGSHHHCSGLVGFLLWVVGFGTVYYQSQLNKVWDAYGNPEPGTVRP